MIVQWSTRLLEWDEIFSAHPVTFTQCRGNMNGVFIVLPPFPGSFSRIPIISHCHRHAKRQATPKTATWAFYMVGIVAISGNHGIIVCNGCGYGLQLLRYLQAVSKRNTDILCGIQCHWRGKEWYTLPSAIFFSLREIEETGTRRKDKTTIYLSRTELSLWILLLKLFLHLWFSLFFQTLECFN